MLAFDDFRGGDGILATTDIRTIADLKGRSVAYGDRGISQFYVNVLLRRSASARRTSTSSICRPTRRPRRSCWARSTPR